MPRTTEKIRKRFMKENDDGIAEATAIIQKCGWTVTEDCIILIPEDVYMTKKLCSSHKDLGDAIKYLIEEWDFGYMSIKEYEERTERKKAEYLEEAINTVSSDDYEIFPDFYYFDMWCVRNKNDKRFDSPTSFHFEKKEDAEEFFRLINLAR